MIDVWLGARLRGAARISSTRLLPNINDSRPNIAINNIDPEWIDSSVYCYGSMLYIDIISYTLWTYTPIISPYAKRYYEG